MNDFKLNNYYNCARMIKLFFQFFNEYKFENLFFSITFIIIINIIIIIIIIVAVFVFFYLNRYRLYF